jgi:hypothetical protein
LKPAYVSASSPNDCDTSAPASTGAKGALPLARLRTGDRSHSGGPGSSTRASSAGSGVQV